MHTVLWGLIFRLMSMMMLGRGGMRKWNGWRRDCLIFRIIRIIRSIRGLGKYLWKSKIISKALSRLCLAWKLKILRLSPPISSGRLKEPEIMRFRSRTKGAIDQGEDSTIVVEERRNKQAVKDPSTPNRTTRKKRISRERRDDLGLERENNIFLFYWSISIILRMMLWLL